MKKTKINKKDKYLPKIEKTYKDGSKAIVCPVCQTKLEFLDWQGNDIRVIYCVKCGQRVG